MSNPNPSFDVPETKLELVRKLLAKAEGTDNEHERETFMKAAADLMAKYGIEQAMIAVGQVRSRPTSRLVRVEASAYAARHFDLIHHIAEAMGCQAILLPARYGANTSEKKAMHIFGYESDIERAEVLYTSLLLQMASGLRRVQIPADQSPRAYRNSWLLGFVNTVARLVREREQAARQEAGTGAELVLADRSAAVVSEFREAYPHIRRSRPRSSGRGYRDGQQAGERANLGGTGLGWARRSLTG